jgi:hypothetical protein
MTQNPIHFGASGGRGVIAEDFTYPNVRVYCEAPSPEESEHLESSARAFALNP